VLLRSYQVDRRCIVSQRQRWGIFRLVSLFTVAAAATALLTMGSNPTPGYGRTWMSVDYVGDGKTGHLLDVYLPATGSGPFPVVVGIYGSAWTSSDGKGPFGKALAKMLCPEGFATVAINHRGTLVAPESGALYASGDIFPAQIHDVKAAVRFIRANAAKYILDPNRIAVMGGSSGGHLAALLGTSGGVSSYTVGDTTMSIEGSLGKYQTTSSQVQAVVDYSGATDFLTLNDCYYTKDHNAEDSAASILIGGPIQEHPEECALANPITYIDSADPTFFIAHGSRDPQIPWCQSQKLYDALTAAGVQSIFKLVAGAGHADVGTPETIVATVAFLKAMLHP